MMRSALSIVCTLFIAVGIAAAEFTSLDINTALAGSTEDQGHAAYKITGGGADIWNTADGFRLVYKAISGDFDMRARISEIVPTNPWAKAGLMIRASTNPSSPHAMMVASAFNGFAFQYRSEQGGVTSHKAGGATAFPFSWVRIIRVGNTLAGYKSTDPQGDEWQFVGSVELALADPVLVGMCVTAHDNSKLCAAQFDSVYLNPSVSGVVGSGTGLNAKYFNNTAFTGTPALSRIDGEVNFNWGTTAPDALVNADNYSVQWSGLIEPQYSEDYTFFTTSDDGVRLWLDGKLLVDNWTDHGPTENRSYPITLQAGEKYSLVMEYYEKTGGAVAKLAWTSRSTFKEIVPTSQLYPEPLLPAEGDGTGLKGEYFTSRDLTNRALVRMDSTVNFAWGNGSPALLIPNDNFSVRWTGQVSPRFSGTYTFYTQSDDGVRLWVDNQLIINNWTDHSPTENSGHIALTAGKKYDIRIEYYESGGGSIARLSWSSVLQSKEVVPLQQLYPASGQGFFAEYYDNDDLTNLKFTRIDQSINFDWIDSGPSPDVNGNFFSVRWMGSIDILKDGQYTFTIASDDGIRLWVDDELVIDDWLSTGIKTNQSAPITLASGSRISLKLEYREIELDAKVKLTWSHDGSTDDVIPYFLIQPHGGLIAQIPESSIYSPVSIDARAWTLNSDEPRLIAFSGHPSNNPAYATDVGGNRFLVDLPLQSANLTPITFYNPDTRMIQRGSVEWKPTDISGKSISNEEIVIRINDSLLLTSSAGDGTVGIDVNADGIFEYEGSLGSKYPHKFTSTGLFVVRAFSNGRLLGEVLVTVVDVNVEKFIACEVGFERAKNIVVHPFQAWNKLKYLPADNSSLSVKLAGSFNNEDGNGATLHIRALQRGSPVLLVRAGNAHGPVVAIKDIDEFTLDIPTLRKIHRNTTTGVGYAQFRITPYIPDLRLSLRMFAHTATFSAGLTNLSINTSDIDSNNQPLFNVVDTGERTGVAFIPIEMPDNESMYCFDVIAFQASSSEKQVSNSGRVNGVVVDKDCELYLTPDPSGTINNKLAGGTRDTWTWVATVNGTDANNRIVRMIVTDQEGKKYDKVGYGSVGVTFPVLKPGIASVYAWTDCDEPKEDVLTILGPQPPPPLPPPPPPVRPNPPPPMPPVNDEDGDDDDDDGGNKRRKKRPHVVVVVGGGSGQDGGSDQDTCPNPPKANEGHADVKSYVDLYLPFITQNDEENPPLVWYTFSVAHNIITNDTPRARDLHGVLRLNRILGSADNYEIYHNGAKYRPGKDIRIIAPHSACGRQSHQGTEYFCIGFSKHGEYALEAEVDPDPDDGGDGKAVVKSIIRFNVLAIKPGKDFTSPHPSGDFSVNGDGKYVLSAGGEWVSTKYYYSGPGTFSWITNIPVDRYIPGNVQGRPIAKSIENGVISSEATLWLWSDIDNGVSISINGKNYYPEESEEVDRYLYKMKYTIDASAIKVAASRGVGGQRPFQINNVVNSYTRVLAYELSFNCMSPHILVHGKGANRFFWRGRSAILGGKCWQGVADELESRFIPFDETISLGFQLPRVSQGTIEDQGEELGEKLPAKVNEFGTRHFNIIAHSKGGLDSRHWLGTVKGSLEADLSEGAKLILGSFITLNTPHRGSVIADYAVVGADLSATEIAPAVNETRKIDSAISLMISGGILGNLFNMDPDTPATVALRPMNCSQFNTDNFPLLEDYLNVDDTTPTFIATRSDADKNGDGIVTNDSPLDELIFARCYSVVEGTLANAAYQSLLRVKEAYLSPRDPNTGIRHLQQIRNGALQKNDLLVSYSSAFPDEAPSNVFDLHFSYDVSTTGAKDHGVIANDHTTADLIDSGKIVNEK